MRNRFFKTLLLPCALALLAGCTRIKPDEIGVRTANLWGQGITPRDYEPGFHRNLWPLDSWHRFPSTVQSIAFTKAASRQRDRLETDAPLLVTSSDGDRVLITAEVFFRIEDNAAHRVLQDSGPGDRYRDVVRGLSQDAARTVLGRLNTEDFYEESRREQARRDTLTLLKSRLDQRGIHLVDFLIQTVEFDLNYENLIKEKKIADQRVELESARARAAEERGKVARIQADTTVLVQKIEREMEAEITGIRTAAEMQVAALRAEAERTAKQRQADADLYRAEKEAEGQRRLQLAEAEGVRRKNQALTGEGTPYLVAMEALRKINLTEVTFPSIDYDWFSPYEMAARVGAGAVPGAPSRTVSGASGAGSAPEGPDNATRLGSNVQGALPAESRP